ncbi:MAG: DinB family protein [Phycisphaerales bacterium]|nr:DinB family protein [Phycisphaerales bacterium]
MNPAPHIASLARFPAILEPLIRPLPIDDLRYKPDAQHWSILEVLAHLADEECEDFRVRIKSTLDDPAAKWPPLDFDNIAERRGYNALDPNETLDRFLRERAASLGWLRSLDNPDWSRAFVHEKFGPMHAGMLLANWAAHDLLHLRQITKRLFELTARNAQPYTTQYAGEWTA